MKRFLAFILGLSLLCGTAGAENMKYRKLSTDSVVEGTNKYYLDSRARGAISSSATGLTYTGASGVFSLASGYVIPNAATDLDLKSLNLGVNGVGGTAGVLTLRDGANPGTTNTISYAKWADLEAVNGFVKCNGSGDYSADSNTYLTGVTADSPLSGAGTAGSHLTVDLSSKQNADATLTSLAALSGVQGDLIYASGADAYSVLNKDTNATRVLTNTGTNNNPAWAQVALGTGVSGTLPANNGGTGVANNVASTVTISGSYPLTLTLGGTAALTVPHTANQLLYASAADTVTGLATSASGVLVTDGSGVPSITTDIPTAVTIGSGYIYRASGTDVAIADGGTNASSFATSNGLLYYNGTALVADTPALTSTYLPLAVANGRLGNSVITQDASGSLDWTSGNTIYIPAGLNATQLGVYITAAGSGDTLQLAAGNYPITAAIALNKKLHLKGSGRGITTITSATANINLIDVSATAGSVISDLTIQTTATYTADKRMISLGVGTNIYRVEFLNGATGAANVDSIQTTGTGTSNIEDCIFTQSGAATTHLALLNVTSGHTINARKLYISSSAATDANGACNLVYSAAGTTTNIYNSFISSTEVGTNRGAVMNVGGTTNVYNCSIGASGVGAFDVFNNGGTLTLHNTELTENTTSGTVTYRSWTAWTPTLVWGTADPASITKVGRYTIADGRCHFKLYVTSADSNACSSLTATLPVTPKDVDSYTSCSAQMLNNATYLNPLAYIDQLDNTAGNRILKFNGFTTCTDGATVTVEVSGEYEI